MAPNQRGIARVSGKGTMWTSSPRLSHLNGGRWKVEGEVNTVRETVEVRGYFNPSNIWEIDRFSECIALIHPTLNIPLTILSNVAYYKQIIIIPDISPTDEDLGDTANSNDSARLSDYKSS